MRRLGLALAILVVSFGTLVGVLFLDLAWNNRAADICHQELEKPPGAAAASSHTIQWEWSSFAYVCRYDAPGEPTKRVGFTNAFL
ncbi:MAG TPA: hypothetical protein VGW30_05090 [Gaiellaceae bacterium]|nr:hypothetical protein [Gaiellaceae bacterium]